MNTEAQNLQEGDFLDYTPAAVKTAGQVVLTAGRAAICATAIAALAKGAAQIKGVVKMRAAEVTGSAGNIVGWDEDGNPYGGTAGTGAITTSLADVDFLIGSLTKDLTATDGEAEVELNEFGPHTLGVAGSEIYASPDGNDAFGNGSMARPYKTIAAALAAVTASRKNIMLMPGEYVQTASLTWPSIDLVSLNGLLGQSDGVTITGLATKVQVINIDPTVQTASFNATISNLTISAPTGVNGITFDNNNVAQKINLFLHNVAFENDTETDKAINCVHTVAGNAMRIYADGQKNIVEGLVYIAPKNTGDRFTFTNFQFDGGVQFGTTTVASVSTFKDCIMLEAGGSGGQDTQILNSLGCYSLTGTTYAAASLNEFAANAAEVIL